MRAGRLYSFATVAHARRSGVRVQYSRRYTVVRLKPHDIDCNTKTLAVRNRTLPGKNEQI